LKHSLQVSVPVIQRQLLPLNIYLISIATLPDLTEMGCRQPPKWPAGFDRRDLPVSAEKRNRQLRKLKEQLGALVEGGSHHA
jgi:hypothetical protein